ncbi:MAG: polysaccharide deacetylase family protein [bacterium]|nr:polysaccharide deacetylase family protein [bacterium]
MKKKSIFILVVILLSVIFTSYFITTRYLTPTITLDGSNPYIIDYKEEFKEPGYSGTYNKKNITNNIKVSGKVNSKKLGDYKITYKVKENGFKKQVVRIVKVRDITKPKIELATSGDIYVCPGKKYQPSYKAIDNYDGDITKKVNVITSSNSVRFSVIDSSGNYRVLTKKIIYKDNESPILTLKGEDYENVYLNEEYKESGYKAKDNCDGDISSKVIIEGNVDTNTPGTYTIKYKVSDNAGSSDSKERKVNVIKKNANGTIYLTFDDGPRMGTTNVILDILKEENVKATFFVTMRGPDELIKREYDEGHTVALHSASHDYSYIYSSVDNYFNDLKTVHDRVLNITGYDSRIIRFPGGSSNTISRKYQNGIMSYLTKEVLNRSYRYFDWNISSGDAGETTDSHEVVKNVTTKLSHDKVNVILMHDIKSYTRDALKEIIQYGKNNGYTFDKLDEHNEMITQKVNN